MKKLYLILQLALILCLIVGCQDKEAMAELEALKAQAEVEEQNIALVLQWWEELAKKNIDSAMELYAPEFLFYMPSNNPSPMTKEENRELLHMMFEAFPDITHKIEEIMAVEDRVIARTLTKFTHTGEYLGIPATGKKGEVSALVLYRIKDRKVVEIREEFNRLSIMQQLGMELKLKEGE